MLRKLNVLLTGRSYDGVSTAASLLEGKKPLNVLTHVHGNGHAAWPDDTVVNVVVLCVDEKWQDTLPSLLESLPALRPPLLVLCPVDDLELLRVAMRAGARDVLNPPIDADELTDRIVELGAESRLTAENSSARLTVFVNAKGGSGASFLAANAAVALMHKQEEPSTVLVDLNFQFGGLPTYLNMSTGNGLIKALEFADTLDAAAIGGHVQKHAKGLHLLAAAPDTLLMPDQVSEERVGKLFAVLDDTYENVLVDLPRTIDTTTSIVLEAADQIVVVTQQSVAHLQDTRRLIGIMREYLGISNERICIVLNRFTTKSEVRRRDFIDTFQGIGIITIPNDYARVAESINLGIPVIENSVRSALSKSILSLVERIIPAEIESGERSRNGVLGWLGRTSKH